MGAGLTMTEKTTEENQRYKCYTCHTIIHENPCPVCGETILEKMCSEDHVCTCAEDIHHGIKLCPVCKEPICPCGSHDVAVITRVKQDKVRPCLCVPGYLQALSGFNDSKRQEVMDRNRYDPNTGESLGGIK